ncbi:MAG: hypothetical protein PHS41_05930 [Victivallaceae bacterium]|nr:hypothetical protein [Victivallaceae bacterium]
MDGQHHLPDVFRPPQTTITPDYTLPAHTVAKVPSAWLNNEPLAPCVTLPYQLIGRESVR